MNCVFLLKGVQEWSGEVDVHQRSVPLQHCAHGDHGVCLQVSAAQPQVLDGVVDLQHGSHTDATLSPHLDAIQLQVLHRLVELQDVGQYLHPRYAEVCVAQVQDNQVANWSLQCAYRSTNQTTFYYHRAFKGYLFLSYYNSELST